MEVWFHSFLTWVLDWGEWLTSRPGRFCRGGELLYPLNRRLGGYLSQWGHFSEDNNILPLQGFESWTVQPVVYMNPTIKPYTSPLLNTANLTCLRKNRNMSTSQSIRKQRHTRKPMTILLHSTTRHLFCRTTSIWPVPVAPRPKA